MSRFVKVKYSMLKDVEFIGGNHTGIFVSKASKQVELNEGEKIQGVSVTPQERMNPVRTSLKGCTLQDFVLIIKGDMINKKKEREIILEVKNCRQEYMFACEWMKNNNGHGDFFFVRCNVDVDRKHDIGVSLRPGEVFLVKNSCYEGDQWLCHSVDPKSGIWSMTNSLIPNKMQANVRRLSSGRSVDEAERIQRRGFKVKGSVYDRVLPMKASVKLPIVVIGPDSKFVSAFLKLIQYEMSDTFYVETDYSDNGDSREFCDDTELLRHMVHYVRPGRLESLKSRSVQKINIFLNVTSELSSSSVMKLFGDFSEGSIGKDVVTQSVIIKQKLRECRHKFEEICLPLVNNRDNLIEKFKKCVTEAQERLLWLSYSEIDEQIAAKYPSYLGQYCDLNKLFQRSQSVG